MKMNRRTFVMAAGAAAGALAFGGMLKFPTTAAAAIPGGTLDPAAITKYMQPLVIPDVMPRSEDQNNFEGDYYKIAVRQFQQQILPPGMPLTTVWSYGSVNHPRTFNYPAFTIEAKYNKPVRVKWINDLKDKNGNFRQHLLPVDQTLHWANPPGGELRRDMSGTDPLPYDGPVPLVVHLHGGHTTEESDGFPEAWFLPDAENIDPMFAKVGSQYEAFKDKSEGLLGQEWKPGTAVFQYDNDQRATTLWYHDHTVGMTRVNVYAGLAGFYLLRGGPDDRDLEYNPPGENRDNDEPITEIPIVIQDRSFNTDGSLFYPDSREFFDAFPGPYAPDSDIAPIWNPEFFGNTMVVNGRTWPKLEKRRYRFRFLNGSDSRFLILKMSNDMPFYQIGADGGFLPAPVQLNQLLIGPAERADVIVDFTRISRGSRIVLQNIGPDEPFGGGVPGTDFDPADPATTGEVMRFDVVARTSEDETTPPARLRLPAPPALGEADNTRQVSLNEVDSIVLPGIGPRAALLGTVEAGSGVTKLWDDDITENPAVNAIEIWEIYNFTVDAHPIHIHEVQFQVVNREMFDPEFGTVGETRPPELWESGEKDTVIAYPGEITRVKARYDRAGLFVWHCHILSHEDHEMMRPYRIG